MNEREQRLRVIGEIISSSQVSSQEYLLRVLEENGFSITQATLSRDLKNLNVAKVPDEMGEYYYRLSHPERESLQAYAKDFRRGYISIAFSHHVGIIKTLVGHANSVALALDKCHIPSLLGTLAGDDTIMIVLEETTTPQAFLEKLSGIMGNLEVLS